MHTYTAQQALRMFERLMRPIRAAHDMAYAVDSHYDGGEFSGPAIARAEEEHERRVLALVRLRTGHNRRALLAAEWEAYDRHLSAMQAKCLPHH
jgi:hypothetical protein